MVLEKSLTLTKLNCSVRHSFKNTFLFQAQINRSILIKQVLKQILILMNQKSDCISDSIFFLFKVDDENIRFCLD